MSFLRRFRPPKTAAGNSLLSLSDAEVPSEAWVSADELIELKNQVRGIQLDAIRPAAAVRSGPLRSRFRGRGMDYLESRNYQPGDDVRHMDWRVTARSGNAHVKVFTEERERPLMFMLDLRQSMFFASHGRFKSVQTARAAALLGWAAVARGDRVGALMLNGGHYEMEPRGGNRGVLQLIRQLVDRTDPRKALTQQKTGQESLYKTLQRMRRVVKPGSLAFLLSDFQDMDEDAERQLMRLREHSDVVALQFTDRLEQLPLPAGVYGVSDGQQQRFLDLSSGSARARYLARVASRQQALTQCFQRCSVPLLTLYTHDDVALSLREATHAGLLTPSRMNRTRAVANG